MAADEVRQIGSVSLRYQNPTGTQNLVGPVKTSTGRGRGSERSPGAGRRPLAPGTGAWMTKATRGRNRVGGPTGYSLGVIQEVWARGLIKSRGVRRGFQDGVSDRVRYDEAWTPPPNDRLFLFFPTLYAVRLLSMIAFQFSQLSLRSIF